MVHGAGAKARRKIGTAASMINGAGINGISMIHGMINMLHMMVPSMMHGIHMGILGMGGVGSISIAIREIAKAKVEKAAVAKVRTGIQTQRAQPSLAGQATRPSQDPAHPRQPPPRDP